MDILLCSTVAESWGGNSNALQVWTKTTVACSEVLQIPFVLTDFWLVFRPNIVFRISRIIWPAIYLAAFCPGQTSTSSLTFTVYPVIGVQFSLFLHFFPLLHFLQKLSFSFSFFSTGVVLRILILILLFCLGLVFGYVVRRSTCQQSSNQLPGSFNRLSNVPVQQDYEQRIREDLQARIGHTPNFADSL